MGSTINPYTGKMDMQKSTDELDAEYLRLDASNDPLTGELEITPASGTSALMANKDIKLLSGQKLIFDA